MSVYQSSTAYQPSSQYTSSAAGQSTSGGRTRASENMPGGAGGSGIDVGGLLSSLLAGRSRGKINDIYREGRDWQVKQNTIAYERSLPWSSYGPAGDVEFDPETRKILQTLSPEFQAQLQGFLGAGAAANAELQRMQGDPYAMEQEQMKRFDAFNADRDRRNQQQADELSFSQGLGGTQEYYRNLSLGESVNKRRLQEQLESMGTGMNYRNMLRAEDIGYGEASRSTAGMLTPQIDVGSLVGSRLHTDRNMRGIREGGQDYTDTRAGFYGGMLADASRYRGSSATSGGGYGDFLSSIMSNV
jgi:hypothetical protein